MTTSLFNEFPDSNLNDWKLRLAKDLKGIGFDELSTSDRNGLPIHPFYNEENGKQLATRFLHSDWHICSSIRVENEEQANRQALKELQGGANALCFQLTQPADYTTLLKDIDTDIIHLRLELLFDNAIVDYPGAADPNRCSLVVDPIALSLGKANTLEPVPEYIASNVRKTHSLNILGTRYQNAGAGSTYELACILAHTNEYLNSLQQQDALKEIQVLSVSVAVGTLFFEEIAKLRALRANLESLLAEYGIQAEIYLHAESSDTYRSPVDVHSNLLRDSIAGMAAVIGGCNALSLLPFDATRNGVSELSSRMSRNQQLLFKEESYLNHVADMAAGSFYLDELTELIADKSWDEFYAIENAGGFLSGMNSGSIPAAIAKQSAALLEAYRSGEQVLIGVNKYPNPTDAPANYKPEHAVKVDDARIPLLNIPQALIQS